MLERGAKTRAMLALPLGRGAKTRGMLATPQALLGRGSKTREMLGRGAKTRAMLALPLGRGAKTREMLATPQALLERGAKTREMLTLTSEIKYGKKKQGNDGAAASTAGKVTLQDKQGLLEIHLDLKLTFDGASSEIAWVSVLVPPTDSGYRFPKGASQDDAEEGMRGLLMVHVSSRDADDDPEYFALLDSQFCKKLYKNLEHALLVAREIEKELPDSPRRFKLQFAKYNDVDPVATERLQESGEFDGALTKCFKSQVLGPLVLAHRPRQNFFPFWEKEEQIPYISTYDRAAEPKASVRGRDDDMESALGDADLNLELPPYPPRQEVQTTDSDNDGLDLEDSSNLAKDLSSAVNGASPPGASKRCKQKRNCVRKPGRASLKPKTDSKSELTPGADTFEAAFVASTLNSGRKARATTLPKYSPDILDRTCGNKDSEIEGMETPTVWWAPANSGKLGGPAAKDGELLDGIKNPLFVFWGEVVDQREEPERFKTVLNTPGSNSILIKGKIFYLTAQQRQMLLSKEKSANYGGGLVNHVPKEYANITFVMTKTTDTLRPVSCIRRAMECHFRMLTNEISVADVYCVVYVLKDDGWKNQEDWSQVLLYRDKSDGSHRIVGFTVQDFEVVINCNIGPTCKYTKRSADFHRFCDEDGTTYGFGFYKKDRALLEAEKFMACVLEAIGHNESEPVAIGNGEIDKSEPQGKALGVGIALPSVATAAPPDQKMSIGKRRSFLSSLPFMKKKAAHQRNQEADKILKNEAIEEMQQEVHTNGGLQYYHIHGMLVGKFQAGKSSVVESIQGIAYKANKGSTKGADLVEIEIAHLELSGDSTWRVVDQQTHKTYQQRALAQNLAAKYYQKKRGGKADFGKALQQPTLEDFQRNRLELQRQRKGHPSSTSEQTKQQAEVHVQKVGSQSPTTPSKPMMGLDLVDEELLLGMVQEGKIKGDELSLSLWDMGGQDVFHSLHHLFLKRGALFLVLFDMCDLVKGADPERTETCLSHLRFWLRSLQMHTYEEGNGWAPIFLVGTHKDKVSKHSEHAAIAAILNREFQGFSIYNAKKLYKLPNGREFPFFPVDNTVRPVDPTVKELMKAVEATARNEEYMKRKIPVPWVNLFDALHQEAKQHSWLSREEVVQLATQCGLTNLSKSVDLVLAYLHDQGRVLYFADQPSLRDVVILDPTKFFLEPVTRIICEFDTHHIPAHDECIKKLPIEWRNLKSNGMLDKRLLPFLWADLSEDTREYLLALMIKFGLAVELQADASAAADQFLFLVPALLPKEVPSSLKESKLLEASCSIVFYPREEPAAAELETNVQRVKAVGFLPSGFFSRLLGKCFSWSQGWSAGVNWNGGWSFFSAPAQLFQKRARLSFGALRFEISVSEDLNLLHMRCGHENPCALLRRLLLLCEEVIEEALGGALLVWPYLEREGALVRLDKVQDAVRRGMPLVFDQMRLQPEQVKQEFSPGWFPPAQAPSKFDVFWSFRQGTFDSALVGKLEDRLLDMGVPPFHMAQLGLRSEQTLDALTRSRLLILVVSVQGLQPFYQLQADSEAEPVLVEWALALELLQQKRLQSVLPLLVGPNADRSRNEPAFLQRAEGAFPEDRLPDVVVEAVVSAVTKWLNNAKLTPSAELKTRTVREIYRQLMAQGLPWGEDVAANLLPSKRARGDAVSLVDIPLLSLKLAQAMDDVRVAEGIDKNQETAEVATAIAKQNESEAEFRTQIEQAALQANTLLQDEKAQQQLTLSTATRVEAKYVAFLSHAQGQAGDVVRTIFLELDRKCWYDKEQVERTLAGMIKGIAMSEVFLIYLSKAYFTRPFCRFELQVARLLEKPIVVVREASERPTRGPITFPQIEACDKQLLELDILALSDELRDAFSTGFIPLLKARINTALGKEVLAPASPTAAAAPAASPNSPAKQMEQQQASSPGLAPQSAAITLVALLKELKLDRYITPLEDAGYEVIDSLEGLTKDDLVKDVPEMKPGHANLLLKKIESLKK
eukprot:g13037.t1